MGGKGEIGGYGKGGEMGGGLGKGGGGRWEGDWERRRWERGSGGVEGNLGCGEGGGKGEMGGVEGWRGGVIRVVGKGGEGLLGGGVGGYG